MVTRCRRLDVSVSTPIHRTGWHREATAVVHCSSYRRTPLGSPGQHLAISRCIQSSDKPHWSYQPPSKRYLILCVVVPSKSYTFIQTEFPSSSALYEPGVSLLQRRKPCWHHKVMCLPSGIKACTCVCSIDRRTVLGAVPGFVVVVQFWVPLIVAFPPPVP